MTVFDRQRPRILMMLFLAVFAPGCAWADCDSLKSGFDAAASSRSGANIIAAFNKIEDDTSCDFEIGAYKQRTLSALIDAVAVDPSDVGRGAALDWIDKNIAISGTWRSADKLGALYDKAGERGKAREAYELAISLAQEKPQNRPTDAELKGLAFRSGAGKLLASNDDEGHRQVPFARSIANPDGTVGGVYSVLRVAVVGKLPLPVNFVYGTAEMTPVGRETVKELAAAVAEQDISAFRLIGHADPRGDARLNVELSKRRAAAAAAAVLAELHATYPQFLSKHPTLTIGAEGKGATEQIDISALNFVPSQEELWALDRRVEFELSNP